ncbi:hypothetical protein Cfla_1503 [Cellulomonas flavigena DSM 20109]|uniref:Transmembrane protein n=1 Tax=Cellulomonas flavigena (strain ATCC 482 / DSM 20109 / BCRC 11376 / JCM 18109 / NBRC 3775 / NCIMB 8073 / NRS 134) TaxID=446466 RepID=D5UD64_CELFN|nr:hypothetical protein [Cellulomonas flavigena]ADG74401.1 hypothetical protein Cfla_1503 [Cellulomonas flavigena DSM 20109]
MTAAPALVRDHALPLSFAVLGGITQTCSVAGLALLTLGHGVAAWALMMVGTLLSLGNQLRWRRRVDGRPLGNSLGAVGLLATVIAVLVVAALGARAVVTDLPWLAALVALAAGAVTTVLLRWWQLRPVRSPV